jgi:para-aminobenzoate synthetase/4-amino-4-deoxychorismate lyase
VADDFELLEGLRWQPNGGYTLMPEHMQRLTHSATHFGFTLDVAVVQDALARCARDLNAPHKVRLLLARDGSCRTEVMPLPASLPVRARLAREPIDPNSQWLRHKTTRRALYERTLAAQPDVDDVILWNPAGEVTETCVGNLVVERDGKRLTPPLSSGLLPGTFRAHLLATHAIAEAPIRVDDLPEAQAVHLINSVRGWCPIELV